MRDVGFCFNCVHLTKRREQCHIPLLSSFLSDFRPERMDSRRPGLGDILPCLSPAKVLKPNSKSAAERSREFRQNMSPADLCLYREAAKERASRSYHRVLTEEEKAARKEAARIRSKQYRDRKKAKALSSPSVPLATSKPKPKTKVAIQQQREQWRRQKEAQRAKWGPQERCRNREKSLISYYRKKALKEKQFDVNLPAKIDTVIEEGPVPQMLFINEAFHHSQALESSITLELKQEVNEQYSVEEINEVNTPFSNDSLTISEDKLSSEFFPCKQALESSMTLDVKQEVNEQYSVEEINEVNTPFSNDSLTISEDKLSSEFFPCKQENVQVCDIFNKPKRDGLTNVKGPSATEVKLFSEPIFKKGNSSIENYSLEELTPIPSNDMIVDNISEIGEVFEGDHMNTHREEHYDNNKCIIYNKFFNYKSNLKNHKRVHTGERHYKCSLCGKSYTRNSHLSVHMNPHTEEKHNKSKCLICNKFLRDRSGLKLKNRMRIHTDERPYGCTLCGKSFEKISHLSDHVNTHNHKKEKPCKHECIICNKFFNSKSNLKSHMRMHTGKTLYKCGGSFSQSSNLSEHMNTHTEEKHDKSKLQI